MSLSSLPSVPKIKNEFTEILTKPELSSLPTTSPSEFFPIITETSFLEPKTKSLHIPTTDLVEYYDQMFPTLDMYKNFLIQNFTSGIHILSSDTLTQCTDTNEPLLNPSKD